MKNINDLTEKELEEIGEEIAFGLGLKSRYDGNYFTDWGVKSKRGLALTIIEIITDRLKQ